MRSYFLLAFIASLVSVTAVSDPLPEDWFEEARAIGAEALESNIAYDVVESVTTEVGPRLAGTQAEARAREWAVDLLNQLGFDEVRVEPFQVPLWERHIERGRILTPAEQPLVLVGLGGSASTPPEGVVGEVLRVESPEALAALSDDSAAGKIIFVDHTFCYHPAVEKIKTIDIGRPLYFDSTRISLGLFQPDVDVILDLAIHDVSIINFLYPDLELSEKYIVKNNHVNDVANQAIINLKFTNGFTANINVNWVSPVKKRQIILTGNKSSIVYDDIDNDKIKIYQTGDIKEDYNVNKLGDMIAPRIDTTEALLAGKGHFLECIKHRTQPRTNIYESLKIMEWLLS